MKKIILYAALAVLTTNLFSQEREIVITTQISAKGEVTFQANNSDYCDYFLTMNFTQLSNTSGSPNVQVNVRPGVSQIFRLAPTNVNQSVGFGYSYTYVKGNSNPKLDAEFSYLLPVKEGKKTEVLLLQNIREFLGKPVEADWYALSFSMMPGDTVYASRAGIVCGLKLGSDQKGGPGTIYSAATTYVDIYHADGTFGKYNMLKSNALLVHPGTRVKAGDAIGIVDDGNERTYVSFMVYHLNKKLINISGNFVKAAYSTVQPKFALTETTNNSVSANETYSVIKPLKVVMQEMSKKEKERYMEGSKTK